MWGLKNGIRECRPRIFPFSFISFFNQVGEDGGGIRRLWEKGVKIDGRVRKLEI